MQEITVNDIADQLTSLLSHPSYTSAPLSPMGSIGSLNHIESYWTPSANPHIPSPSHGVVDAFNANPQARAPGHERASARSSLSFEGSREDVRLQALAQMSPAQGHISPLDQQLGARISPKVDPWNNPGNGRSSAGLHTDGSSNA